MISNHSQIKRQQSILNQIVFPDETLLFTPYSQASKPTSFYTLLAKDGSSNPLQTHGKFLLYEQCGSRVERPNLHEQDIF